jgi:hypothetical protein
MQASPLQWYMYSRVRNTPEIQFNISWARLLSQHESVCPALLIPLEEDWEYCHDLHTWSLQ